MNNIQPARLNGRALYKENIDLIHKSNVLLHEVNFLDSTLRETIIDLNKTKRRNQKLIKYIASFARHADDPEWIKDAAAPYVAKEAVFEEMEREDLEYAERIERRERELRDFMNSEDFDDDGEIYSDDEDDDE